MQLSSKIESQSVLQCPGCVRPYSCVGAQWWAPQRRTRTEPPTSTVSQHSSPSLSPPLSSPLPFLLLFSRFLFRFLRSYTTCTPNLRARLPRSSYTTDLWRHCTALHCTQLTDELLFILVSDSFPAWMSGPTKAIVPQADLLPVKVGVGAHFQLFYTARRNLPEI